jgi:hypothetical protein
VGEGESKDIHASVSQPQQGLVAIRGRTDGGYDLRAAHAVPFVNFDKSRRWSAPSHFVAG